jgi:rfaE bifunctional protein kinase chain/domain
MSEPGKQNDWLEDVLAAIPRARVTVFGDFCLDAYWLIDPDESELSVETGLPVRRVREQRYSLGGASNIAANLAALGAGRVRAVGRVGDDLFGGKMLALLGERGIDCEGMLAGADWQSGVFAKPCVGDEERNRIDFGGFNVSSEASIDALVEHLDRAAGASDAVILNQQVPAGVSTPAVVERLNAVVAAHPECRFIADSRHRPEQYAGCLMKFNTHEAARMLGEPRPLDEPIDDAEAGDFARRVFERTGKAVFVTRGERGLIVVDETGSRDVGGIAVQGPIDTVGAGDTVTAGIAAVLGSGGDAVTAARLANLAASVVVRKLQTTGTADPDEVRRAAQG